LGEALLDSVELADLLAWLQANQSEFAQSDEPA
jgi:hypothetical protein